jgi:hypothetical protein
MRKGTIIHDSHKKLIEEGPNKGKITKGISYVRSPEDNNGTS